MRHNRFTSSPAKRELLHETTVATPGYVIRTVYANPAGLIPFEELGEFLGEAVLSTNHSKTRKKQPALDAICEELQWAMDESPGGWADHVADP